MVVPKHEGTPGGDAPSDGISLDRDPCHHQTAPPKNPLPLQ